MAPPPVAQACPACSAAVRPGAPWCTQCYADLRPARALAPSPAPVPARVPAPLPAPSPVPSDAPPPGPRTWPCLGCGTPNDLAADACTSCGAGFLAAVSAEQAPALVLPVVGDLVALRRGQRVGLALGVVLVALLLSMLLVALVS